MDREIEGIHARTRGKRK